MTMRALWLAAEFGYFTSRMRQPVTATFDDDMAGLARSRAALRALG